MLVAATANPDKLAEIAEILGEGGIELLPRPAEVPDVVEDAPTLEGNARLKAAAICAATGLPAVADDTGLEVDALDGAPGVYSARYSGAAATDETNVAKLLAELDGVPTDRRKARFRTAAVVVWPDGSETMTSGSVEGTIAAAPVGSQGFGYDPVFVPADGDGRTFSEMSADEKHAISHRGRAFRALLAALRER